MNEPKQNDQGGSERVGFLGGLLSSEMPVYPCIGVLQDAGRKWWLVDLTGINDHLAAQVFERIELDNADDSEWSHYLVYLAYRQECQPYRPGPAEWEDSSIVLAPNPVVALQTMRQKFACSHPGYRAYTMMQLPALPVEPCECADGACYRGYKDKDGNFVVTKDGVPLSPKRSIILRNHSPAGFAWGYGGSGPSQLALGLLLDASDNATLARLMYQRYKAEVVSKLPDSWVLCGKDILNWLEGTKIR